MNRLEAIAEKLNQAKLPDVDFEAYLKANETDSQKVKRVVDYYDEIEHHIQHGDEMQGSTMPFAKMKNLFGFRGGEVTLWTGFNGHKKSMLLGFVAINFMKQGERVCTASFEMKPVSTIKRMTRQYTQSQNPSYEEYANFMSFAGSNFYIFDHLGGISPERIYGVIMYCANELGVKHFIIDSLMRVVAGEDKYNEQKDFVVKLCDIAIKTKSHIHLVHHTKKGKEDVPSGRYDAKGSGAISDNVHNSLIVWSNKENNKEMPDVILKCDKQREGEWEGKIALKFDNESMRFEEAF
jgi:twinkle protein